MGNKGEIEKKERGGIVEEEEMEEEEGERMKEIENRENRVLEGEMRSGNK